MALTDILNLPQNQLANQVIGFAAARQQVIANNIANIDTPGYRMRDLDVKKFEKALSRAVDRSRRSNASFGALELPSMEALSDTSGQRTSAADDFRGIVFHDDNDRSIEKLTTAMVENYQKQQQAVNILRSQVRLLRAIVAESAQ